LHGSKIFISRFVVPSVIVSWTGQCREQPVRRELSGKLAEIAAVAKRRRSGINKSMT